MSDPNNCPDCTALADVCPACAAWDRVDRDLDEEREAEWEDDGEAAYLASLRAPEMLGGIDAAQRRAAVLLGWGSSS